MFVEDNGNLPVNDLTCSLKITVNDLTCSLKITVSPSCTALLLYKPKNDRWPHTEGQQNEYFS